MFFTFLTMPYCRFCGKLCPTVPGLNKHVDKNPYCKKASHEEFGHFANSIWDEVPDNPHDLQQQPLPTFPIGADLPDFHLEDDIQRAEKMFNGEGNDIPPPAPPPPPPLRPQHATVEDVLSPDKEEVHCYIEKFPEEYLAGATWGNCKPLYEYLDEEQRREGGSRWSPFEDEDEWHLAEWLI